MDSASVTGFVKSAGGYALALLVVAVIVAFGSKIVSVAPGNAIVVLDLEKKTYLAPPCANVYSQRISSAHIVSLSEARSHGYETDEDCRDKGSFMDEPTSIGRRALERAGLVKPRRSRWNPDGTWNW